MKGKICSNANCKRAGQLLSYSSDFYKNKYMKDGYSHYCKECDKIRNKAYRQTAQGKQAYLRAMKKFVNK